MRCVGIIGGLQAPKIDVVAGPIGVLEVDLSDLIIQKVLDIHSPSDLLKVDRQGRIVHRQVIAKRHVMAIPSFDHATSRSENIDAIFIHTVSCGRPNTRR